MSNLKFQFGDVVRYENDVERRVIRSDENGVTAEDEYGFRIDVGREYFKHLSIVRRASKDTRVEAKAARKIEDAGPRPNVNEFFGCVGYADLETKPLDMAEVLDGMRKARDRQLVKDEEAYRVRGANE